MKRACKATLWACILPVTSAMGQSSGSTTQPASGPLPPINLFSLQNVKVLSSNYGSGLSSFPLTALPLNSAPIAGYVPQMVYSLTNEHFNDIESFASDIMGGSRLPFGSPKYFVATVDSGAQSHILSYADSQAVNLGGANLLGAASIEVVGANGSEWVNVTDGLGVYVTGFGNASVSSGVISASTTSFTGMYNTSVLTATSGSSLPSVIGAPMIANNRFIFSNSQPKHLTVGTQTFRTPNVSMATFSSTIPAGYSKLTLRPVPEDFIFESFGTPPQLTPNFNESNYSNNPDGPTAWYTLMADNVSATHTFGGVSGRSFLFDTGAQVSVISEDVAAQVGYFTAGENPSTPDFFVAVSGVGGAVDQVPGFYMNSLSIVTNGGPITWNHVPVLVLNLPNPAGGATPLDGILGTNLFTDRDLILNADKINGVTFAGISPQWRWNNSSGGTWGNAANWTLALPSGMDTQANFYGAITSPKTVVVDSGGFTVGTINFDNVNRYTLNGPGRITLQVSTEQAQINVSTGSHTINAPMTLANDTIVTVSLPASRLTINSDVTATGVTLFKQGPGMLEMKNVRSSGLTLNEGTVMITASGGTNGTSRVSSLLMAPTTLTTATAAHLDLNNNALIVDYTGASPLPTLRQYLANGYNGGAWNGDNGIESSMANSSTFALGSGEKSVLGLSSFAGQSLPGDAVVIKYTYYGDTNLDGYVNVVDLYALALHWNTGGVWTGGDFNYDNQVNIDDLRLLAANWLRGAGNPLPGPALGEILTTLGLPEVEVPEPGTFTTLLGLSLLAAGGSRLRARPRRV